MMTRIQFGRRPDRPGSSLDRLNVRFGTRGPQIICFCAGICNLVDGLRGLLSFQAARKRMWIVHWADALLGTSDAPQQETSSQPKVRVGEQSADIEVVAAQIRLRGRDQASKKLPTSKVNSQMKTLNTLCHAVKCLSASLPACLPACLSVCLSVCLSLSVSLSRCLSVSLSVSQVCPCICRSGVWCEVPTRSPSPSDLSSQTLPLFTSLFAPPSLRCKRHG